MAANGKASRVQFGLVTEGGKPVLGASRRDVATLTGDTAGRAPWRAGENETPSRSAFRAGLAFLGDGRSDGQTPEELAASLRARALGARRASSLREGEPVAPRESSAMRERDADAAAEAPETPRAAQAGAHAQPVAGSGRETRRSPGRSRTRPGEADVSDCVRHAIRRRPASMLQVLRCVAIERMRTAVPGFTRADLDSLVMATGYAPAAQPHAVASDFFHVVAANLANAGGPRPDWAEFADAVVRAMRAGGCFAAAQPGRLHRRFTDRELAGWLAALAPLPAWGKGMLGVLDSAGAIAAGHAASRLHASMIGGIVDVANWLQENYGGSVAALHAAMTANPTPPHRAVFDAILPIDRCRGHGIPLAANLLKDSQAPGLAAAHDPRSIAGFAAGWFAKPDLHVIRFMAKISRGSPLSSEIALSSMARSPIGAGTPGHFPGNYAHLPSASRHMRVIADIHDWAAACGTSPLEIDRVLYLTGAKTVEIPAAAGGPAVVTAGWYAKAEAAIDAALAAGAPRMS